MEIIINNEVDGIKNLKKINIVNTINIELKEVVVLDSIDNNVLKIKINKVLNQLLDNFKNELINQIYLKSKEVYGVKKNLNTINDYYCDPLKLSLIDNNYEVVLTVNNNSGNSIEKNNTIDGIIEINSVSIYNNFINPYFSLISSKEIINTSLNLFVDNSDSDSEIDY